MSKDEVLRAVAVAAAHHTEIAELATVEPVGQFSDELLDAGDNLDVAIVLAHLDGATLFDLWLATKLPVRYLAALTNGSF